MVAEENDAAKKSEEKYTEVNGDGAPNSGGASNRQRRKRKWDQPAESLISAGFGVVGLQPYPLPGMGTALAGMVPVAGIVPSVPAASMVSSYMSTPQLSSIAVHHTAAIAQKISQDLASKGLIPQSKIQDECIAREIVINDADPAVRYKLTKRQTQEEIQAKTGAVVITRGKYRPPNGPVESERPLYLHISAGAHLKDMAERIKAVDFAALMVEDIMKHGRLSQSLSVPCSLSGQGTVPSSIAVYVGLEPDPTFNLVGRIRGPNDQYINHIMTETGATVMLKGRGSGNLEGSHGDDSQQQQPLHLFISSDNARSLETAKSLAENLFETVRSEYLTTRTSSYQFATTVATATSNVPIPSYQVASYSMSTPYAGLYPQAVATYAQPITNSNSISSTIEQPGLTTPASLISTEAFKLATRGYNAVPPPQHLLSETPVAKTETERVSSVANSSGSVTTSGVTSSQFLFPCLTLLSANQFLGTWNHFETHVSVAATSSSSDSLCQVPSTQHVIAGTNYSGYCGIYPQATPLQQVALALQRPPPPVSVTPSASASGQGTKVQPSYSNGHSEKQQPEKKRKFQERPVAANGWDKDYQSAGQGTETPKSGELLCGLSENQSNSSRLSDTKSSVSSRNNKSLDSNLMPPPPPKTTLMPPPKGPVFEMPKSMPPRTSEVSAHETKQLSESKKNHPPQPEANPLIKLVEYGEEDDDDSNAS